MQKIRLFLIMVCVLAYGKSHAQNIIPLPQELKVNNEKFKLESGQVIVSNFDSKENALLLQKHLKEYFGIETKVKAQSKTIDGTIHFIFNEKLGKEAYELNIGNKGIELAASNSAGWFYALQSLKQLLPVTPDQSFKNTGIQIGGLSIKDEPRFSWRAFMLDESRHFQGMEQVKLILDEMAYLKMNTFHWHLVDDQGWRIEIKKYPLLTEMGAHRASTQMDDAGKKWQSKIQSGEPHSGFYTQEQIKEILEYAAERHINVVPEIEMPGHSGAAIAAYPWLCADNEETEVPVFFGKLRVAYNVSDPKVYEFLTNVLDEVIALFPSKVIHIGGDEVKFDTWRESEAVQAYMKQNHIETPADLQIFFTNQISQYLQSKERRMMGWNDILGHKIHEYQEANETSSSNQKLAPETVVHFWKGDVRLATQAISSGYDIVNSLHSFTYLDYNYNSIPLSKAYSFDPIPPGLDKQYHDKVIGTGCQMWTEWTPTKGHVHYQTFPRIAAYAEVGWTEMENKDFGNFKERLKSSQARWKNAGILSAPEEVLERKK